MLLPRAAIVLAVHSDAIDLEAARIVAILQLRSRVHGSMGVAGRYDGTSAESVSGYCPPFSRRYSATATAAALARLRANVSVIPPI